jgi:ABC-type multidrug transport system fused ATPase/permease subunit
MSIWQRVTRNFIFDIYVRIFRILTPEQRRKGFWVVFVTMVGAILEVLGVAALVPLTLAATNPRWVDENTLMVKLKTFMGFTDKPEFMVFLALLLLLIFVVKNAIAIYLYHYQSRYAYQIGTELSRRMFIKFYNRGYTYFKNTNSSEIHNRVFNIPIFFSSGMLTSAINFFSEILVLIMIVVGIAATNIFLFLAIMTVLVPSALLIYNLTKNKLYTMGLEQARTYDQVYSQVQQGVFGYTDVRINNKEQVFLDSFVKGMTELNRLQQVRWVLTLIPTRTLEVIAVAGITITFIYTFAIVQDPSQLYGFVAVFAAAAFRVLPSFNRIIQAVMGFKSNEYTLDILEEGELPHKLEMAEVRAMAFEHEIEVRDLTFRFDDGKEALKHVGFKVKKGEKIGIIGESGSGKTTLMNILLRFLEENEGGVFVDGHKLEAGDKASWRSIVGYVQQDVYLIDASLAENVAFGEEFDQIDLKRLSEALRQASLVQFVETLPQGIRTRVGEHGSKVSGGQKQRIGIARSLYSNAQILVFDEATSALDADTELAITESIENIEGGQTIFVIAHRISTLRFCDQIIELKDGQIVGTYTYPELIAKTGSNNPH